MQDDAAVKRSLSVWFVCTFFAEIAKALFEKVQEMLCLCLREEIIGEEEFVLLYESIQESSPSWIKTQPNVKPIFECKTGIFRCFLMQ